MTEALVAMARWTLIALAILLSPIWALWLAGGMIADRCERCMVQRGQ